MYRLVAEGWWHPILPSHVHPATGLGIIRALIAVQKRALRSDRLATTPGGRRKELRLFLLQAYFLTI